MLRGGKQLVSEFFLRPRDMLPLRLWSLVPSGFPRVARLAFQHVASKKILDASFPLSAFPIASPPRHTSRAALAPAFGSSASPRRIPSPLLVLSCPSHLSHSSLNVPGHWRGGRNGIWRRDSRPIGGLHSHAPRTVSRIPSAESPKGGVGAFAQTPFRPKRRSNAQSITPCG